MLHSHAGLPQPDDGGQPHLRHGRNRARRHTTTAAVLYAALQSTQENGQCKLENSDNRERGVANIANLYAGW